METATGVVRGVLKEDGMLLVGAEVRHLGVEYGRRMSVVGFLSASRDGRKQSQLRPTNRKKQQEEGGKRQGHVGGGKT